MMVSMALSACAFLKCSWRAFRRMGMAPRCRGAGAVHPITSISDQGNIRIESDSMGDIEVPADRRISSATGNIFRVNCHI